VKINNAAQAKISRANTRPPDRPRKKNLDTAEAMRQIAQSLEQVIEKYIRLQQEIDAAFGGKLFLRDQPPTSVENMRRFRAHIGMQKSVSTIIVKLTHEQMRVHGVDPNHPQLMRETVESPEGSGAGAQGPGSNGLETLQVSQDALLLAQHLTLHAHTFKKPLPPLVESDSTNKDKN
jgi:hypothetical protein